MPDVGKGALVGRIRARDVLETERADRAGVDQPLDAGLLGGPEDVPCAVDVDGIEGIEIQAQKRYSAATWKTARQPRTALCTLSRLREVTDDLLHLQPFEVRGVGARLDQRDHFLVRGQGAWRVTAEPIEPSPRDKDPVSGGELHSRARCNVPLAIVLPNSKIRARASLGAGEHGVVQRVDEEVDLLLSCDQRR